METERAKRRSLVVRVWLNGAGRIEGQVSDPLSGWRQNFAAPADLWRAIALLLNVPPDSGQTDSESQSKDQSKDQSKE